MFEELNQLISIIKNESIDILITDSYSFDQAYLLELKRVVGKLVSIHDFAPFPFPSDLVINGNIYAPDLEYSPLTANTKFLLGTKYLLMRDEFSGLAERSLKKEVKNILVTTGGGDPLNLTPKIVESIGLLDGFPVSKFFDRDKLHLDIVIGPVFNNLKQIVETVQSLDMDISLHFNPGKMSSLMLKCDLAVSAGGSTLYELAAAGTPTLALLQADNQIQGAEALHEKGAIINLGKGDQVQTDRISESIAELINDFELRKRMSTTGQKLVDGKGVQRCVKEILS